jgi:hypothetical protein
MANLYVFHQGIGGESMSLWYSVFDGTNWAPDTQVLGTTRGGSNLDLASPPSAVAWAGGISVFHQGWLHTVPGAPDGHLWYTYSSDGAEWGPDTLGTPLGMSESPSAVVYNGLLYVFHQGFGGNGQLWYSVLDGANWGEDTQIQPLGMSGSPAAVAWAGGITVFHQGSDNNGQLWYTYSADGANWDPDTLISGRFISGSPSAVVYNGVLYIFYQGGNQYTGQLWYTTYDGTNWGENIIPNVVMSGSPSAVVWAGGITVFHHGFGDDGQLWYTYSPNGAIWGEDTPVQNVGISGSPSCVVV